jgi:hypothetical protein
VRLFIVVVLLASLASAADFQTAKILDVQPYTEHGAPIVAPNNGHPVLIDTSDSMFTLTVAIGDMGYSANYRSGRHFKSSEVIVGDSIEACIDGDKLIIKRPDGKEVRAKITRRARLN